MTIQHLPGLIHMTRQIILVGAMLARNGKLEEGLAMIEDSTKTLEEVVNKLRLDEVNDRYADFPDPTDIEEMRMS